MVSIDEPGADLVEKAKALFRQQKIVGGSFVPYGEAPWTAR